MTLQFNNRSQLKNRPWILSSSPGPYRRIRERSGIIDLLTKEKWLRFYNPSSLTSLISWPTSLLGLPSTSFCDYPSQLERLSEKHWKTLRSSSLSFLQIFRKTSH